MATFAFDFEELEVAEAKAKAAFAAAARAEEDTGSCCEDDDVPPASAEGGEEEEATTTTATATRATTEEAEEATPCTLEGASGGWTLELRHPTAKGLQFASPSSRSRLSRARAWFEIRRFFDAEPQKHYGATDGEEWKIYYAKELILKTTCEKLHSEGFVVIDAVLAPSSFRELVRQLLSDASILPEQRAAIECHVPGGATSTELLSSEKAAGWVGSHCLSQSSQHEEACRSSVQDWPLQAALPSSDEAGHDRALCASCVLSLAHDRSSASALQPASKQQFFRLLKTYVHVVAANSMSKLDLRQEEKIPVQFCFGDMSALLEAARRNQRPALPFAKKARERARDLHVLLLASYFRCVDAPDEWQVIDQVLTYLSNFEIDQHTQVDEVLPLLDALRRATAIVQGRPQMVALAEQERRELSSQVQSALQDWRSKSQDLEGLRRENETLEAEAQNGRSALDEATRRQ
ncbi:unnamed protein product, partial [Polarella glacialis]